MAEARSSAARPRRIAERSHRRRSWSSSSTASPSGPVRAGNRAAVSSNRASRPYTSGSSGSNAASIRASRIASYARSGRSRRSPAVAVEPSVKITYSTLSTAAEPLAALLGRRQLERHSGRRDRLLRPGDPGLDRRHGYQERPRDLLAGQAADRAQRQRHPGLGREHRMAGHEHQREDVVVDPVRIPRQVGPPRPGPRAGRSPSASWPANWRTARRVPTGGGSCRSRAAARSRAASPPGSPARRRATR